MQLIIMADKMIFDNLFNKLKVELMQYISDKMIFNTLFNKVTTELVKRKFDKLFKKLKVELIPYAMEMSFNRLFKSLPKELRVIIVKYTYGPASTCKIINKLITKHSVALYVELAESLYFNVPLIEAESSEIFYKWALFDARCRKMLRSLFNIY